MTKLTDSNRYKIKQKKRNWYELTAKQKDNVMLNLRYNNELKNTKEIKFIAYIVIVLAFIFKEIDFIPILAIVFLVVVSIIERNTSKKWYEETDDVKGYHLYCEQKERRLRRKQKERLIGLIVMLIVALIVIIINIVDNKNSYSTYIRQGRYDGIEYIKIYHESNKCKVKSNIKLTCTYKKEIDEYYEGNVKYYIDIVNKKKGIYENFVLQKNGTYNLYTQESNTDLTEVYDKWIEN